MKSTSLKTGRFTCDNWDEPEVTVTSHGSNHAPSRKVLPVGTIDLEAPDLHADLVKALRSGYDVKLRGGEDDEAFVRFIACVDSNGAMLVRAEALGAFRKKTLADKKPRYVKGGRDISEDEAMSRPKGEAKRKCQSKVDSYVTCPNCQTVVRIGRTADE